MIRNSNDLSPTQSQATDMYQLNPLGILKRKFWMILFFMICSTGLALLYYSKAPKTYESWARVYVDDRRAPSSFDGEDTEDTTVERSLEIITSRAILGDAIARCDTENMQSFIDADDELLFMRENLIATPSDTKAASGVMKLRFQSGQQEDCQIILANVLESFRDFVKQGSQDDGSDMLNTMSKLEEERSSRFTGLMREIDQLMQKPFIQVTEGKVYNQYEGQASKQQEEMDLNASDRLRFVSLRDSLIKARANGENIEDLVIDTIQTMNEGQLGGYTTTHQTYLELKVREKELTASFGADHPEIKSLRQQIEMVDNMRKDQLLSALRSNSSVADGGDFYSIVTSYIENKIRYLQSYESQLAEAIRESKSKSLLITKDCERLSMLLAEREMMTNSNFEMQDKVSEYGVLRGFDWQDVRVIDPASTAEQIAPNLPICLVGGLLLGSLFGFIFGALMEMAEKTFHSTDDVTRQLGVSVVAQVPKFDPRRPHDSQYKNISGDVTTLHRPHTQSAESFKALRTSIFFKAKQERGLKVIQVTSPTPGDGKSVVTANLAVVMAQSGRRILLIDCDLRRQTQHLRFGVPSTTGVTSILAGESTLDDATQSTGVENLRILAAGPPCGNPAEMLTTKSFGRLIAEAREKYDFVLIDTPPVLPVTDPVIISSHVDAVYMPMRIRKGVQVKSQKAVEALALVGRQIEGVVINGLSRKEAGSYGFGGYGNTYAAYGAYGTYGTHNAPAIPTLGKAATLGSFAADDGPSRNGNSARPTATQGKPSTANPKKVTGTASIVNNGTANLHRGHRNGNGKGRVKVASHTRKNEPTS